MTTTTTINQGEAIRPPFRYNPKSPFSLMAQYALYLTSYCAALDAAVMKGQLAWPAQGDPQ